MTTTQDLIQALAAGEHIGDLVWTELSLVGARVRRDDLRRDLTPLGFDSLVENPSTRKALGRAMHAAACVSRSELVSYRWDRERERGDTLLLIRRTHSAEAIMARDEVLASVAPRAGAKTGDSRTTLDVTRTAAIDGDEPGHACVASLLGEYDAHLTYVDAPDLGSVVVQAVTGDAIAGLRLRSSGGIYWVSRARAQLLRDFATVVRGIGKSELTIVPVHRTDESVSGIGRDLARTLDDEARAIVNELDAYVEAGSKRSSVYERKLEQIEALAARAELVADVLGRRAEQVLGKLADARRSAGAALAELDAGFSWLGEEEVRRAAEQ